MLNTDYHASVSGTGPIEYESLVNTVTVFDVRGHVILRTTVAILAPLENSIEALPLGNTNKLGWGGRC
jgi:hypothetical protein